MHTFFVNTSKRKLNYYDILFDICHENMNLVSFNYPMSKWYLSDNGYTACVADMAARIDDNLEITNDFNLVLYIDLCEIKQYASLSKDEEARTKAAFLESLKKMYLRIVNETILSALEKDGRKPHSTLIMFGEDASEYKNGEYNSDVFRKTVIENIISFAGIPTDRELVQNMAIEACESDSPDKISLLKTKISSIKSASELPGAKEAYKELFDNWYKTIVELKDVNRAYDNLIRDIGEKFKSDSKYSGLYFVDCPCDNYAFGTNKSSHTIVQISISLYLAECIYSNSVLGEDNKPREFILYNRANIAEVLCDKKNMYALQLRSVEKLGKTFVRSQLTSELRELNHKKFGLDEHGNREYEYDVVRSDLDETNGEGSESQIKEKEKTGVRLIEKEALNEFPKNAEDILKCYSEDGDSSNKEPTGSNPNVYKIAARKIRDHHVSYLSRFRKHSLEILSRYSSDSAGNHTAILAKRAVSVADSEYIDDEMDYKYATKKSADKDEQNKQTPEVADEISERAYNSVVMRYLDFCSARTLAITDIEAQTAWFERRIDSIAASIRNLGIAGICTLLSMFVLYIPYLVLQGDSIFSNPAVFSLSLISFLVPLGLFGVTYFILAAIQKSKFKKTWKIFVEKTAEAAEENDRATQMYEELLAKVIPALRWIYEYKLDVDFHIDLCNIAKSKIEHHKFKLKERVMALGNMTEDLEVAIKGTSKDYENGTAEINLSVAYCVDEKNIEFYSILDGELLKKLRSKEKEV